MNKSSKIILISLGTLGACIGVYFLFFRKKKGEQFPEVEDESKEEKEMFEVQYKDDYTTEGVILEVFSQGNNVKCLQSVLNVKGCKDKNGSGLMVDGKFGPLTESALEGCGEGKSISINRLKKMMQEQLNAGLSVDCSDSSCCASLVSENTDNSWDPSGDDDGDGIPNSIDLDSFNPPQDDSYIHSIVPIQTDGTGGGYSGVQYALADDDMYFSGENRGFTANNNGEALWNKVQNEQDITKGMLIEDY